MSSCSLVSTFLSTTFRFLALLILAGHSVLLTTVLLEINNFE